MSWLGRVFGGKKVATAEAAGALDLDVSCSFCGLHRREVRKLIAGPKIYICDRCIALCVEIMQEEARKDGGDYHVESLLVELDRMGPRARHADLRPLLRAVIELARGDAAVLRRVAGLAAQADDPATALEAQGELADDARTGHDELAEVGMLLELGRRAEADEALAALPAPTDPGVRLRAELYRLWSETERGPLPAARLDDARAALRRLGAAIAELGEEAVTDHLRVTRYRVTTAIELAHGELAAAEDAADAWLLLDLHSAHAHVAMAEVKRARGDDEGARRELRLARDLAHPDGALARKLATGDGPFR